MRERHSRRNARRVCTILTAAGLLWVAGVACAANVADDCAGCHEAVPVPETHEPVEPFSVATCVGCHEATADDPFIQSVHTQHLDLGFQCADCHGTEVPAQSALDALLK